MNKILYIFLFLLLLEGYAQYNSLIVEKNTDDAPVHIYIPIKKGTLYNINVNSSYIGIRENNEIILDYTVPIQCDTSKLIAKKNNGVIFLSIPCKKHYYIPLYRLDRIM